LVLAEGDVHKKHRKVISTVFNYELLKTNMPMVIKTCKETFDEIESNKAGLDKVLLLEEFQKITGTVVGRIFFGEEMNENKI